MHKKYSDKIVHEAKWALAYNLKGQKIMSRVVTLQRKNGTTYTVREALVPKAV